MKRKNFLRNVSLTAPLLVTFNSIAAKRFFFLQKLSANLEYSDRVLVLIQLNGGNDVLNTFIPLSNYEALTQVRKNILIPENKILKLETDSSIGLHPSLKGLQQLYMNENLTVIHGVGYPNPDFSHFKGINIKLTANCNADASNSGWVGRYLDQTFPKYATHETWKDNTGPPCTRIGDVTPLISQGEKMDLGIGITDIENLNSSDTNFIRDSTPNTMAGNTISHISNTLKQVKMFAPIINAAAEKQQNLSRLYNNGDSQKYVKNNLTEQLRTVARLIGGGLGTRIYVVCQNGYDTHANQVEKADTTQGCHAELLGNLSDAIAAFEDDLKLMGKQDQVLGMTFSEFGRRIKSSDSLGTDHGTAESVIFFGSKLKHKMLGNEALTGFNALDENLAIKFDFRALYASVLKGWFGISNEDLKLIIPQAPQEEISLFRI